MKNRVDLPDEIRGSLRLGADEVLAFRDGSLLALAWRAAKKQQPVIMLSTKYSAGMVDVPTRQPGSNTQRKPSVMHKYNQHINGVDMADQLYYLLLVLCSHRSVLFFPQEDSEMVEKTIFLAC